MSERYMAAIDSWQALELIVAEWDAGQALVDAYDARLVERVRRLVIQHRIDAADDVPVAVSLTYSQLMALRTLVLEYMLLPRRAEVFVDPRRQGETTPEELLERLMRLL